MSEKLVGNEIYYSQLISDEAKKCYDSMGINDNLIVAIQNYIAATAPVISNIVDVSWLNKDQYQLVSCLDWLRSKMIIERAENDSEAEVERCTRHCAYDFSGVVRMARNLGLPISGNDAQLAIESNGTRDLRAKKYGGLAEIAADALDALCVALDHSSIDA